MAPVFEQLAGEFAGKVKFAKVNTEDEPALAAQFRITSIPTLLAFHRGQLVDGAVGALPKPHLAQFVNRLHASSIEADQDDAQV
jgi:thioredoxin-like negative regulator of GroEL